MYYNELCLPLDDGESIPSIAIKIVMKNMKNIWMPVPIIAAKSRGLRGDRNTSPWTNFHPLSSSVSSKLSSVLYFAMSRLNVRTIIIVSIPEIFGVDFLTVHSCV